MAKDREDHRDTGNGRESDGFSSPPCFMHELAPEYLGYLSAAETEDLLSRLEAIVAAGGGGVAGRLCETLRHGAAPRIEGLSAEARHRAAALLDDTLIRIQPSPMRDGLEALRRHLAPAGDPTL